MTLIRITLTWRDATMHGHQQYTTAEFADGLERQLTFGTATGWLVFETKDAITIATDRFAVHPRTDQPCDWRTVSSYPTSGILWLHRDTVQVPDEKTPKPATRRKVR